MSGLAAIVAWIFAFFFATGTVLSGMHSQLYAMRCNDQWAAHRYTDEVCRSIDDDGRAFIFATEAFVIVAIVCSVIVVVRRLRGR